MVRVSIISIRISDKEKKLMERYASFEGITLPDYIKNLFYEKVEYIEDMKAIESFEKEKGEDNFKAIPFDKAMKDIGL